MDILAQAYITRLQARLYEFAVMDDKIHAVWAFHKHQWQQIHYPSLNEGPIT